MLIARPTDCCCHTDPPCGDSTSIGEFCKIDIFRNCARQQQALQACHELTCMFLGAMLCVQYYVEHWHVPKT